MFLVLVVSFLLVELRIFLDFAIDLCLNCVLVFLMMYRVDVLVLTFLHDLLLGLEVPSLRSHQNIAQ